MNKGLKQFAKRQCIMGDNEKAEIKEITVRIFFRYRS